ncbi:HBL145Cp [Eremothecium sinecaudum]|uniref:HBL145Cp n=1 Tax=Eremothecium sinecaudum TaxID=45286 RepID=A0A109UX43_9SACH|nr:HBL145Cp [Eremothecium sinecaudum]AMD18757.1 HBL145Cp [Eremothecium sinecaudum]
MQLHLWAKDNRDDTIMPSHTVKRHDVRRHDLIVGYQHVSAPLFAKGAAQGMLNQSMPMVAMFLKNKFLAWFALLSTWHNFLIYSGSSGPEYGDGDVHPLFKVGMAFVSLIVCYMNIAFPQFMTPPPAKKN